MIGIQTTSWRSSQTKINSTSLSSEKEKNKNLPEHQSNTIKILMWMYLVFSARQCETKCKNKLDHTVTINSDQISPLFKWTIQGRIITIVNSKQSRPARIKASPQMTTRSICKINVSWRMNRKNRKHQACLKTITWWINPWDKVRKRTDRPQQASSQQQLFD